MFANSLLTIAIALAGFLVLWRAVESTNDGERLWATLLLSAAALALIVRRRLPVPGLLFALLPYAVTHG